MGNHFLKLLKGTVQLSIPLLMIVSLASLGLAQQKPFCDGTCIKELPPCCQMAVSDHSHEMPHHKTTDNPGSLPCCTLQFCDFNLYEGKNVIFTNNAHLSISTVQQASSTFAETVPSLISCNLPAPRLSPFKNIPTIKLTCTYLI